jgi:TIR domain
MTSTKVFISYSRQDEQVADRIVSNLDGLGLDVWVDRREIQPGDSFLNKMNQGLGSANYILVLFSNASLQSQWVEREWMSGLANHGTTLIPIRLESEAIPPLLKDIVYIDFVQDQQKGLESLKSFFQREFSLVPLSPQDVSRRDSIPLLLQEATRRELRLVAQRCVSEDNFMSFLFDEDIDPSAIGGNSLNERLVNLLHFTNTEGILKDFAVWLNRERKRCVENQLKLIRQGYTE